MYRVYDNKEKRWVKEGVYLSPNNDLSISKKALFGAERLSLVSDQRYVYQNDIGLYDKKKKLIFEGDICKIEHLGVVGVVAYVSEHASYYVLDDKNLKYYTLGEERCEQIEVIGNIFENEYLMQYDNIMKEE